jgi:hypothetical protein
VLKNPVPAGFCIDWLLGGKYGACQETLIKTLLSQKQPEMMGNKHAHKRRATACFRLPNSVMPNGG